MKRSTRTLVAVRLNTSRLDELAEQHDLDRSQVIRACLAVAFSRPVELAEKIKAMKETA